MKITEIKKKTKRKKLINENQIRLNRAYYRLQKAL